MKTFIKTLLFTLLISTFSCENSDENSLNDINKISNSSFKENSTLNNDFIVFDKTIEPHLTFLDNYLVRVSSNSSDSYTYNMSHIEPIEKIKILFDYNNYIDFEEHNVYVEKVHNLSNYPEFKYTTIKKEEFQLESLIGIIGDNEKAYSYNEYLKIDNNFNLSKIKTKNLLNITNTNSFFYSKPFLLYLESLYGSKCIIELSLIKTEEEKENIIINIKNINELYDISYNPPNGNPK